MIEMRTTLPSGEVVVSVHRDDRSARQFLNRLIKKHKMKLKRTLFYFLFLVSPLMVGAQTLAQSSLNGLMSQVTVSQDDHATFAWKCFESCPTPSQPQYATVTIYYFGDVMTVSSLPAGQLIHTIEIRVTGETNWVRLPHLCSGRYTVTVSQAGKTDIVAFSI